MLNLRGIYFADTVNTSLAGDGTSYIASAVRFRSSLIVGNLGATIAASSPFPDTRAPVEESHPVAAFVIVEEAGSAVREGLQDADMEDEKEWYEDSEPAFVHDPFRAGMAMDAAELVRRACVHNDP